MNWLLRNFGSRVNFALRNPRYAARSLYRELTLSDERFLSDITRVPARRIRSFLDEPTHDDFFVNSLQAAESFFKTANIMSADLYAKKILLQYATIRAFAPDIILETGVANGVSSSYLLLALEKNRRGKLYSVEVGDSRYLPPGKPIGWIVPDRLKSRWNLRIGDSRELLPKLLAELSPGGLLISDDAGWNPAFPEFCAEVRAARFRILRGVGFLQNDLS